VCKRTKAVSSCGLEISAGLASGFDGPGEEPRDGTGVLEPGSPFEEPLEEVTLSGWAERGDDICVDMLAPTQLKGEVDRLHVMT
jgi:hypothetical protein